MTQLAHNEKMSPELLPYQLKLVDSLCHQIASQEKKLANQQARNQQHLDADERFYSIIHRMELERVKFVLKTYLRARLAKIERHLLYIVEKDQSSLLS